METERKVKVSRRNFLIALVLLLLTNIIMGIVLTYMSKKTLRSQIEQRMLDVSNSAAAFIDGDGLKTIAPQDKDTEIYQNAYSILHTFATNIELEYIYVIYPKGDGTFTFGIDPDTVNPGEYGDVIEATAALQNAAKGIAAVDKVPHSDEWGRFYTSYSPFFDSDGNVVGIVGVDFNADWYDEKLNTDMAAVVIITMVGLTVGIVLSFAMLSQNRRRFSEMLQKLAELERETQKLDNMIMKSSIKKLEMMPESESALLKTLAEGEDKRRPSSHEYDTLYASLSGLSEKLRKYLKYLDSEINIDDTTGLLNKVAYKKKIHELDESIADGSAAFSVAFFDINGLKKIYTQTGFEAGEKLMYECAKILKTVYGKHNVYHVTGDEFIAITEGENCPEMSHYFRLFEEELEKYNSCHTGENLLSVAKGFARYEDEPEKYRNYRILFIDAEARCMENKAEHYKKLREDKR